MTTPDVLLSQSLNDIAAAIDKLLTLATGVERVPFVLVTAPELHAQYVANCNRADGVRLLKGLLERWGNPAGLPDLPEHQKEEMLLRLRDQCKAYHAAIDSLFAMLIEVSRGKPMAPFFPSQSPMWATVVAGAEIMREVEAQLAFARELADTGPMPVPDVKERH
jgi:hypothetical protein